MIEHDVRADRPRPAAEARLLRLRPELGNRRAAGAHRRCARFVLAAGPEEVGTMANLSVRKGEPRQEASVWDPFRGMEPMRALDPLRIFRDLMGMDPFAGLVSPQGTMFAPDFEVKETKDGYLIQADLPGVQMKDLEVSITGNRLTVTGRREEEQRREDDRYYVYERSYGTFSRSFVLPEGCDVDQLKAKLDDGVLQMMVPKKAEVQPRRIEVGGKEGGKAEEPKKTEQPTPKKAA
jgi:HSP20 family protein